jgi:hypothetical protein
MEIVGNIYEDSELLGVNKWIHLKWKN